ncbi:amidase family protein [Gammaproteobacteria bacterium]|nr:amidase family protein [Gammaproteobacteria bacterium]
MKVSELTAREIVSKISQRELTCLEVAGSLIEQARMWANINSLINFNEDQFLTSAHNADQQLDVKEEIGILHGLPLIIKDNIDVKGFATTAATQSLKSFTPKTHGPVVNALLNAGAITMAKANMHELAFTPGITKTRKNDKILWGAFGATKNPYDNERSPSGSSTGTAAAISAGLAPVGLGTDTGGSVRNPSAWCGISGLRPSINRYSQNGVVPLSWTRDTIGPMGRTAADLALLDSVITGNDKIPKITIPNLRIGIDKKFFCVGCDREIYSIFNSELDKLAKEGAEIIEVNLIGLENLINQIGHSIVRYEVIRALPAYLKGTGLDITYDDLVDKITASGLKKVLKEIISKDAVSEEEYYNAIHILRPALKQIYTDIFSVNNLDILAFPSTLVPANKLNDQNFYRLGEKDVPYLIASSHNVQPATLSGNPGLTLPMGLTSDRLPVAIGFDAPPNDDRKLLSIGMAYEKIKPKISPPKFNA